MAGFWGVEEGSIRHAAWIAHWLGRGELAPLGADDITELATLLSEDYYPPGTTIFQMGQTPTRVHIVRSGAVELSRDLKYRRAVLQILRPGDVVGDIPLLLRTREPFDAVTCDESLILSIDALSLHRLLEQRPRLAWRWLVSVSERMAGAQARLVELLAGGLETQIASVLIRQANHGVVRLSQTVLAELVGSRRSSVNRILRHLQDQELLRVHYGYVEILDEAGLAMAAGLELTDHTGTCTVA